jgi:choice-of-anchor C domain-containing protein
MNEMKVLIDAAKKLIKPFICAGSLCVLIFPIKCEAQTLLNGSFEDVDPLGVPAYYGSIWDYHTGDSIGGWLVSGRVELIGTYWQAADGVQSLDLTSGGTPGAVSQQIATVAGTEYQVSFAYSANPDGGGGIVDQVSMRWNAGVIGAVSLNTSDTSHPNMDWQFATFDVIATGPTSTLGFENSSSPGPAYTFGPVIDDVSITCVPDEGSTLGLLSMGLMASFGFVITEWRRLRGAV